jgi:hypothetical protein
VLNQNLGWTAGYFFGVAYLRDELTAGTIEVWFHTGQNHPMIQQHLFLWSPAMAS